MIKHFCDVSHREIPSGVLEKSENGKEHRFYTKQQGNNLPSPKKYEVHVSVYLHETGEILEVSRDCAGELFDQARFQEWYGDSDNTHPCTTLAECDVQLKRHRNALIAIIQRIAHTPLHGSEMPDEMKRVLKIELPYVEKFGDWFQSLFCPPFIDYDKKHRDRK